MSSINQVPENYEHQTRAINWNAVKDPVDIEVWNRANNNVWWPERIPISNDIPASRLMLPEERLALTRALVGLTYLDTLQAEKGLPGMQDDVGNNLDTQHELHVYKQFEFMECFTADHALLTPKGWVSIAEITTDDEVLQYVPETNSLEFVNPVQVSNHYTPYTLSIGNQRTSCYQRVSPKHRVYAEQRSEDGTYTPTVFQANEFPVDSVADLRYRHTGVLGTQYSASLTEEDVVLLKTNKDYHTYWAFDKLSSQWCKDFLKELELADLLDVNETTLKYRTEDDQQAAFVEIIAALAGFKTRVVQDNEPIEFVVLVNTDDAVTPASEFEITQDDGALVYGVEVPSTFLFVKAGSSTLISGNCVHARSYSSIFTTILSTQEINAAFLWSEQNKHLQRKGYLITEKYVGNCPLERRQASVWLESFMFYSGFFYPLLLNDTHKLSNTADVIKLIAR